MKPIKNIFCGLAIVAGFILPNLFAQTASDIFSDTNTDYSSLSDFEIELKAVESTTPTAAMAAPQMGTFYSAQHAEDWPPLPENINNAPVWNLGDGLFLLSDLDFNYNATSKRLKVNGSMSAMDLSDSDDTFSPDFVLSDFGTNLWLAITNLSGGTAGILISNTQPDIQYEIQGTTNLTDAQWVSEGFVYGSELTNWTPASAAAADYPNLFFRIRSWIDSDNVGIPDWWQLQYFGTIGIDPYAASPAGDGFDIFSKYQSGLAPTTFVTPPAPSNFVAVLSTNRTDVLLSWAAAQGSVMDYTIVRRVYDFDTYEFDYFTNTVSAPATSFTDVGVVSDGDEYDTDYAGDNTSGTASSHIYDSAPPPPTPPTPTYNIDVSATLIRNATGRWQLMFAGLPANAQSVQLIWGNGATANIPASNLTNGIYQIPDTDSVNHLGDTISVQGMQTNGEAGTISQAGVLANDAPYFVDGRAHLKQDLDFLIRAASLNASFGSSYVDSTVGEFNQGATNFEEFSFLHHGSWNGGALEDLSSYQLDNLWPFTANYYLANFLIDTRRTNYAQSPWGVANFNFMPDFATNIPARPILTASPYWIVQPGFGGLENNITNWGIAISDDDTMASLQNGIHNLFGLPFQTGYEIDFYPAIDPSTGLLVFDSIYQFLAPGGSVTVEHPEEDYIIGEGLS
ncbi:MAG TPA: hypothetical protein VIK59_04125 [Verrucomicrobiae bacterium]